jgi:hypothetical protein
MQNSRCGSKGRCRAAVLSVCILHFAFCISLLAAAPLSQAPPVPLDTLLRRVFAYVERFEREFGSMVAEERYEQAVRQVPSSRGGDTRRDLRSDFLLVKVEGHGWTPFRDVFEADGRQVRDREDRLGKLFLSGTTAGALEQGRRIMAESARYNLGAGTRNTNVPTLVLMFLEPDTRGGMLFVEGKPDRAGIGRVLEFSEVRSPTLITTTNGRDLPVYGRIWVDEATGTITRAEVHADDTALETELTVTFEYDETVNAWVPKRMEDRFKRRSDPSEVRGVATYSRFRRFQVTTSEQVATDDVKK